MLTPAAATARDMLVERAAQRDSVRDLFAAACERLRRLVSFEAAAWLATDPRTGVPAGAAWLQNMRTEDCARMWELELLHEDVNAFRDLTRATVPVAGLRKATANCPARSARYREILRPKGFDDELRAVIRADGTAWATITLLRGRGGAPFDADEIELVTSLCHPLAVALREHVRRPGPAPTQGSRHGAGLLLFAADGGLLSANDDARALLDELEPANGSGDHSARVLRLPLPVAGTLVRARAIAEKRDHGPVPVLMRSRTGRWLACHGCSLHGPDGHIDTTAVLIEPARPAETAPILMAAYELSPRQQQITELIARGTATAEIAGCLHLSAHTVRDHVKSIFEKVGVTSRGELVAKLFGEPYAPSAIDARGGAALSLPR